MPYQPKSISLDEANVAVEQLIMTQHRAWRPNTFLITEHYMGWGSGGITRTKVSPFAAKTVTTEHNERVYFNRITNIQLNDWQRKGHQFYTVSIIIQDPQKIKHILRTQSLSDAQLMINSVSTILNSK